MQRYGLTQRQNGAPYFCPDADERYSAVQSTMVALLEKGWFSAYAFGQRCSAAQGARGEYLFVCASAINYTNRWI